ncbi:MAG TPA: hypothetical protein VGI58_15055 [Streptosporangiaceae bacterium]
MANYPADYVVFHQVPPTRADGDGTRHWHARGQNFVVAYLESGSSGVRLQRTQPDEWMLLLPEADARARITVDGAGQGGGQGLGGRAVAEAHGETLSVIPAGAADVQIGGGPAVAIFSSLAADLCELAVNAGSYVAEHDNVVRSASPTCRLLPALQGKALPPG